MCNIAGYVGTEPAAPILLDMIEAQEGLAGGYYTGIATIDDAGLHWAKVVGDSACLRAGIGGLDLPGAIGIAHSRSNSGGDCCWSHPFVGCDDSLAYVANGSMGCFDGRTDTAAAARYLEERGHIFTAVADEQIGGYPALPGGRSVHVSDVMAHAIGDRLRDNGDPSGAIESAFIELPAEIVGLFILPTHMDAIFGARYNLPMCVGLDESGAYIASSPVAFAAAMRSWTWVQPSSVVTIRAGGLQLRPLGDGPNAISDDISRGDTRSVILAELAKGEPRTFGELAEIVKPLSQRHEMIVVCDPVYEALYRLEAEGAIERELTRVPGARDGLTAPQFHYRLAPCHP